MRKFKRWYVAGAVLALSALALPAISSGSHGVQPADITFTPKGKATAKGAPGTLSIRLGPAADDPATADPVPPKPSVVHVDLSQGLTVSGAKFPECTQGEIEGLDPAAAQAACGNTAPKSENALIATGDAKATLNTSPPEAPNTQTATVDATALAFNGPNNQVLVYSRVESLATTVIVPCSLGSAPDQSLYDDRFTCNVPPLAGGSGALTEFNLLFNRIEKKKKKKSAGGAVASKKKKKKINSIVFGKCPSGGSFNFQVTWNYTDHETESRQVTKSC
jgi:hypothetical protein